jgi:endonuclease/exonuclease/phosphatase family metal-dependent hydrolase
MDVTVASWNIRAGLGRDFRRRPARTIDAIAGFDADVVVLQEADFHRHPRPTALPILQGRIGPFEVIDLTPTGVGLGWHGIGMLKRPGIRLDAIHRHDLPALEPRGGGCGGFDPARCRAAGGGRASGPVAEQPPPPDCIYRGAARLAELDHRPTIIAGDYNEWRDGRGWETLPDWLQLHSPGPSFPSGRPFLHLDRLAYSRDLELQGSAVMSGQDAIIASDHRPVWARFRSLAPSWEADA